MFNNIKSFFYLLIFFFLISQRQDTDERLRRLQNDKESLALQVQVLSEQVNAQNEKISDLERLITDKAQLISNTEDLLQRVSEYKSLIATTIISLDNFLVFNGMKLNISFFIFRFFFIYKKKGNVITFIIRDSKIRTNVGNE